MTEPVVRGVIVPVIKYDSPGKPQLYVVEHNDYQDDRKHVESGQVSFLSETFRPGESVMSAFTRCLSEELGIPGARIDTVLKQLKTIGQFEHPFSSRTPNNDGYQEPQKYWEYFATPDGYGRVVVMVAESPDVLPIGLIETREVRAAGFVPFDALFNLKVRQSYNPRIIAAEMQRLGFL
jgi:hypothetical protein